MCIRDRFGGALRQCPPLDVMGKAFGQPLVGGFRARWDVGPVSYTHLRAHETVLDLVCRLLLEKTNTHRNDVYLN